MSDYDICAHNWIRHNCPHCDYDSRIAVSPQPRKTAQKRVSPAKSSVNVPKHQFDSKTEARRYAVLFALERANVISDLVLQPEFELKPQIKVKPNAIHNGYTQAREIYTADFMYQWQNMTIVEDVKGTRRTKKTKTLKPRSQTRENTKHRWLVYQWHMQGKLDTHTFVIACEHRGGWVYFDSNHNQIEWQL